MSQRSFIVIGAGVIGASVAFRLAQGGAKVTVIEAGEIGSGTSSTSFAWVNAHDKSPRAYHDLNVAGRAAHREIAKELKGDWYHETGCLEWRDAADRDAHVQNVERLQDWGYNACWITRDQAIDYEPVIDRVGIADAQVTFFPDEGWLDTASYVRGLLAAASALGTHVVTNTRVTGIEWDGQQVLGIETDDALSYRADVVVNCMGRWADDSVLPNELQVPMSPSYGLLVYVDAPGIDLNHVLFTPRCHIRPDRSGGLLICKNDAIHMLGPDTVVDTAMPEVISLIEEASRMFPKLASMRASEVKLGIRAIPADGLPAIGPLPSIAGYYVAIMHSGVTLAPAVGTMVAAELLDDTNLDALAPFRPSRLVSMS
ncbi:NAD(P)/FAD-dependent oxidoreductase [Microvirga pudoricolor]|uniref:NAD(P)/FAD-dependent oxidoreductase n=1 Tax=Microvirga pudoricolor TaxID=2778729 RepID=UPI001950F2AE|nr:FAD-dependent oxidoreductase [Microvirga pudoricolor]MBM6595090.1 FAD-binding oxidoreductase [Microvirga pudoricolor]